MKTLTTVVRIRENGGNNVYAYMESVVSDANKASEIAKKLQEANDLQNGDYKYVVMRGSY
jgi:hypothetical protein|tara:strand:- start:191 stop:370 length:180 start_codon:yes stop_codon:yes gene_type:complete